MGAEREKDSRWRSRFRQAREKVDDLRFEASYQFDRVMQHPVAGKIVEFVANKAVERLTGAAVREYDRRKQAKFQASLPPDSPWKTGPAE